MKTATRRPTCSLLFKSRQVSPFVSMMRSGSSAFPVASQLSNTYSDMLF